MDRSANMRAIRSKGMKPEIAVRSMVHRLGFRFRLHRADLPGKPDIVLGSHRKVILVNGCFWHCHGCRTAHTPRTNQEYWGPKLIRNVQRDRENVRALRQLGYRVLTVWECEVKSPDRLHRTLTRFLNS